VFDTITAPCVKSVLLRLPFAAVNLRKRNLALPRVDAVDASRALVVKSSRLDGLIGEGEPITRARNRILIFVQELYGNPGLVVIAGLNVLTVGLGFAHLRHLVFADRQHDIRLAAF
jgi:hypothetical protein